MEVGCHMANIAAQVLWFENAISKAIVSSYCVVNLHHLLLQELLFLSCNSAKNVSIRTLMTQANNLAG